MNENNKVPFSFSMLGWALNEEESISHYIEHAEAFLKTITDDYELIIIDDGSTDHTWEIMEQLRTTRPWLRVYKNESNRGSGYNTKRAISLAQKEYLFWQTVDWAYDITNLGASMQLLTDYDVLQGVRSNVRTLPELFRQRSDTPYKALVSITNYLLVRVLFQLPLSDFQNVTVYPSRLIQAVHLESESAFTNPECLLKTWWQGVSIKEIPTPFIKRRVGQAKGTRPKVVLNSIRDILKWWFLWIVLGQRTNHGKGRISYWYEA